MTRQDNLMTTLFGQLELLHELAMNAGDAEMAQDISVTMARGLERYCEAKRASVALEIDASGNCNAA